MMPFGGMKPGVGRESGIDAVREYQETKSVWISTATDVPANPFVVSFSALTSLASPLPDGQRYDGTRAPSCRT
ncbi:hypothetical protein QA639_05425 [Bradyrhizobium pachyrhizi]|uniref:hypothetical protein n=1 Tax=Bradyrhizobium pachyrhizi TaxID=280333 RepID=UPI0024B0D459|nr:hypothetical protein [Bradyrhizobium pachyrhizi]WFU56967.1 hypothetical protein QA639_05425 [Bradyrhizobium pachyrhizi]